MNAEDLSPHERDVIARRIEAERQLGVALWDMIGRRPVHRAQVLDAIARGVTSLVITCPREIGTAAPGDGYIARLEVALMDAMLADPLVKAWTDRGRKFWPSIVVAEDKD